LTAFITGYPPASPRLLARFLPPLADGVAAHYIEQHTRLGDLVFDPFGQSPAVSVEALHVGRRILVANFNPISRLNLSLSVRPPAEADLRSALTALADVRKDELRLEDYLLGFYRTTCIRCGSQAIADSYEWDAESGELTEKTYACQPCGDFPQHGPADDADRALAKRFARSLDYYLLLDRVAARDDPDRVHAEEALSVYPPRTVAAIAAALVKLDQLDPSPEVRRLLCGLLVAALDATCALTQDRPKALTASRRYREHNFWRAMERGIGILAGVPTPSRSVLLPDLLAHADRLGIHAHTGPARDLASSLPAGCCALLISAIPRPNQAYWTLSALWAAWLWGRESTATLRSVLRRRRYDWAWHAAALRRAFASVLPALAPEGKAIGLVAEAEPGFNAGLLAAADGAGYSLAGAALRADTAEAQLVWGRATSPAPAYTGSLLETAVKDIARQAAAEVLLARGEPSRWMTLHFGAWRSLAERRLLAALPDDPLSLVNRWLEPAFRDPRSFQRLGAEKSGDPATGMWSLPENGETTPNLPLADRVEARVLQLLASGEPVDEHDLVQAAYSSFPGVHTPGRDLVLACLNSYAERVAHSLWRLRREDASTARAKELESIQAELRALAVRHGYTAAGANPLEWREDEQVVYLFAVITSAVFNRYVLGPQLAARKRFLVLPGGRAGLAAFKLRRDPRLRAAMFANHWVILKFRHVRRMADDTQLTRTTLEPAFYADPLEETKQLSLMSE